MVVLVETELKRSNAWQADREIENFITRSNEDAVNTDTKPNLYSYTFYANKVAFISILKIPEKDTITMFDHVSSLIHFLGLIFVLSRVWIIDSLDRCWQTLGVSKSALPQCKKAAINCPNSSARSTKDNRYQQLNAGVLIGDLIAGLTDNMHTR